MKRRREEEKIFSMWVLGSRKANCDRQTALSVTRRGGTELSGSRHWAGAGNSGTVEDRLDILILDRI